MLLTITNTSPPATDLGYLLHENPARAQSFELPLGPFDIIGDVHGCADELVELLVELGYGVRPAGRSFDVRPPEGRRAIFLGDEPLRDEQEGGPARAPVGGARLLPARGGRARGLRGEAHGLARRGRRLPRRGGGRPPLRDKGRGRHRLHPHREARLQRPGHGGGAARPAAPRPLGSEPLGGFSGRSGSASTARSCPGPPRRGA